MLQQDYKHVEWMGIILSELDKHEKEEIEKDNKSKAPQEG